MTLYWYKNCILHHPSRWGYPQAPAPPPPHMPNHRNIIDPLHLRSWKDGTCNLKCNVDFRHKDHTWLHDVNGEAHIHFSNYMRK